MLCTNGSPAPVFETDEGRSYFLVRPLVHVGFPQQNTEYGQVTEQVTEQVLRLLEVLEQEPLGAKSILKGLALSHRPTFIKNYLQPAMALGAVEMTQPDSPRSPTQKYRLTHTGKQLLAARNKDL